MKWPQTIILGIFAIALCGVLPSVTAAKHKPLGAVAEQQDVEHKLRQIDDIVKARVLKGKGDSFTVKLYYKTGVEAAFKPNHRKWRRKLGYWNKRPHRPYRPELAVYRLSKAFNHLSPLVYPAVVKCRIKRAHLLRVAVDDPKTKLDEKKYMRRVLFGKARGGPRPAYDKGTTTLTGSCAQWVTGKKYYRGLIGAYHPKLLYSIARKLRKRHEKLFPKTMFLQWSNMLVMDLLVGNNDRVGNVIYNLKKDRVYPIDNDDSFTLPHKKGFHKAMVRRMSAHDPAYVKGIGTYLEKTPNEQIAQSIFTEYSRKRGLIYARQLRDRYNRQIVRLVRKKPALRVK